MNLEQAKYWLHRWTYELGKVHRYEPLYKKTNQHNNTVVGWDVVSTKMSASQEEIISAMKYLAENQFPPFGSMEEKGEPIKNHNQDRVLPISAIYPSTLAIYQYLL